MEIKDNFSNSDSGSIFLFQQSRVPVFQNKVYATESEARSIPFGDVELVQSGVSGFMFNNRFNPELMVYDENYQNEQANSGLFQEHLRSVLHLLLSFGIKGKKVVEVGSGKGMFFEWMLKEGVDCYGFDPTYEGVNPRIKKEYFSDKHKDIDADVIVMRHTLEHIPMPFSFIHTIARANNYKGHLFVEVPTFDWIADKKAFWDIFYEHCNYFTEQSLSAMFTESETGSFFSGQYIYIWADLSKLKPTIGSDIRFTNRSGLLFQEKIDYYRNFLKEHPNLAIWGAGGKGSTFLNLMDPEKRFVKYVIDINPVKQNKYIAGTAHPIYSPEHIKKSPLENILIMNENYYEEIRQTLDGTISLFNL